MIYKSAFERLKGVKGGEIFYYYIILYDFKYLSVSIFLFPCRYQRFNLSDYHLNCNKF